MKIEVHPRRSLRRFVKHSLLAGAGLMAAPHRAQAAATEDSDRSPADDDDDDLFDDVFDSTEVAHDLGDPFAEAARFGRALARMTGFDATRTASLAALSADLRIRHALALSLAQPFRLVGDDFVIEQLAADPDASVRDAAARAAEARRLHRTVENPPRRRVLVIDDYPGGRAALCACLAELGCEAIGTSSNIANREVPWPEHVDVIVTNDEPPWIDGPKLVAQLRQHAPELPAIVIGEGSDTTLEERATHHEITLRKPFGVDELARAIERLLH